MTDNTTVESAALEQRASDPRLEQVIEQPPVVVDDSSSVDDGNDPPPALEAPTEEQPPVVKPKKTAEEVLKGRVGHLTKTLSTKDQEIESVKSKLAAAEALLSARVGVNAGNDPNDLSVERPANVSNVYTQADFEAAVAARAKAEEFNRKADEMYNVGAEKYQDWKDAVDTLVVSGFMNTDLVDAAMAIEDGPAVLHYLGTNLDEAERISSLTPIRKAAEMAKLSSTLSSPRVVPVSSAPAPIKPVSGSPSPQLDLNRIADTDDMSAYAAARAKQGSRWAKGRGA